MSTIDDGGPAFPDPTVLNPRKESWDDDFVYHEGHGGMSLRQWYAGQILSRINTDEYNWGTAGSPRNAWPDITAFCLKGADAMIATEKAERGT